jgi:hypothetical protein
MRMVNTMTKLLSFLIASVSLFAQPGPGILQPLRTPATLNYYMATTGNDSNVCSSASKCLTLAHVRTLIPQTHAANYIINVADGTYAETLDLTGFVGTGLYVGTYTTSIKILGNTGTPANVVFSGTGICSNLQASFHSVGCFTGSGKIILSGLTISSALETGVGCFGGTMEYNKVVITLTGGPAQNSRAVNNVGCTYTISGDVTVSGFDTASGGSGASGGFCWYDSIGTKGIKTAGTLTCTGPGTGGSASADGTHGYIAESLQSGLANIAGNITISGVQTGVLTSDGGNFRMFDGALSITNGTTTPTTSNGFEMDNGYISIIAPASVTVDHYTTCLNINQNAVFRAGASNYTFTNCTQSSTSVGGQVSLF